MGKKRGDGLRAAGIAGVLRMAALSLQRSSSALSAALRRKACHKRMKVVILATGRKLATLVYRMLAGGGTTATAEPMHKAGAVSTAVSDHATSDGAVARVYGCRSGTARPAHASCSTGRSSIAARSCRSPALGFASDAGGPGCPASARFEVFRAGQRGPRSPPGLRFRGQSQVTNLRALESRALARTSMIGTAFRSR